MSIASLRAFALDIPFKVAFRHASAERAATQTFWVEAGVGGATGYGESCPREYVTGESIGSAAAFFRAHREEWRASMRDVESLRHWVSAHTEEIDRNPAAWAAVEIAMLDLMGKQSGAPLETLLGLAPVEGRFRYTAVLGDAPAEGFAAQLRHYREAGFADFKVKLSGVVARDREKVRALIAARVPPERVRADANNLWQDADAAIAHLAALGFSFWAVEEPLRIGDYEGLARLAEATGARVVLDESLVRPAELDALRGPEERWLVNLRVAKMGGVLRSLALIEALRQRGFHVIVGAHVGETSVLTRVALTIATAAREILVAQEGAFGTHLLARDVAQPPLMFGAGGVLDAAPGAFAGAGLGLAIRTELSDLREIEVI